MTDTTETRGGAEWVARRLRPMWTDPDWSRSTGCNELIEWLYSAAARRAKIVGVAPAEREEMAQDAMPKILAALRHWGNGLASAENPAALLERVVNRAVSEGMHRMRMEGMGGVPPNGRSWRTSPPRSISGDVVWRLVEEFPDELESPDWEIEKAAAAVAGWVVQHMGLVLTRNANHAVVYILDRLICGISRGALVRGGHAGLGTDPAMRHLGFDPTAARAFGRWLLGRTDRGHAMASVLDAALLDEAVSSGVLGSWRRTALDYAFATTNDDSQITCLPIRPLNPDRRIA